MPRSGTNAESAEDHMAQLRRQVEQKKLEAMRQRLLDKQETLMHMQNNNLPSGSAGHATDEMSRFAHEQLNRVHAAQERLLSVASSEPISVSRSAPENSAPLAAAGANRGFSKLNSRPDLFLASAAPVAFVPPNFMPARERELRPVFVNDAPAPPNPTSKIELFKPTSPSIQRASHPARPTASARDEAWERKRQQAMSAGSVQPSVPLDFPSQRSKQPEISGRGDGGPEPSDASAKGEGRSLRDAIWEQKKKSRGLVDGAGIASAAALSDKSHPGAARRVSFAPNDDASSEASYDLIQRVFGHSEGNDRRDAPNRGSAVAGPLRSSFDSESAAVPSRTLQQERNRQLSQAMEGRALPQKSAQQDLHSAPHQRRSSSVPQSLGDGRSNVGFDTAVQHEPDARSRQQEYAMELQQQMQQKQMARRMPDIDSAAAHGRLQGAGGGGGGGLMLGEGASQREADARSRQQEYAMELQQQMREKELAKRMQGGAGGGMQHDTDGRMGPPQSQQQRSFEADARSRQQEYAMELQQQMRERETSNRSHYELGEPDLLL
jgi:hypothetical protein